MPLPWSQPPAHVHSLTVSAEHIDVLGHANNCEYPKWMEAAAWGHCHELGLPFERWQQLGYAWVARHTEVDYLSPAMEHEHLLVATWIGDSDGRLSMTRHYEIRRASDGKLLASGLDALEKVRNNEQATGALASYNSVQEAYDEVNQ